MVLRVGVLLSDCLLLMRRRVQVGPEKTKGDLDAATHGENNADNEQGRTDKHRQETHRRDTHRTQTDATQAHTHRQRHTDEDR